MHNTVELRYNEVLAMGPPKSFVIQVNSLTVNGAHCKAHITPGQNYFIIQVISLWKLSLYRRSTAVSSC